MDYKEIIKIISENYDKGIIGGIIAWVTKKVYGFLKPRIKKLNELYDSVDKIIQIQKRVEFNKEENIILREMMYGIIKNAPYAMYILNEKNEVIKVNTAWLKITGFSDPEEAYGTGYYKAIHGDDLKKMHQVAAERIGATSPTWGEVNFKNIMTGDVTFCEYRTEVIKNSKGSVINYMGSLKIVSITPKK